jgi:ABC-type nitrate/sulfonate/bicarbonate transport system substrate-binding protein
MVRRWGRTPVASLALQSSAGSVVVQRGGNYIQFIDFWVVSAQYLATHPGTIKRYITGFAEAAQYVRAHPDETADMMQQVKGVSRETVRAAVGFLDPDVHVSKATVLTSQQGFDFAIKIGALRQAPAFAEMFDLRILNQVEREHPELFNDLPPIADAQKF